MTVTPKMAACGSDDGEYRPSRGTDCHSQCCSCCVDHCSKENLMASCYQKVNGLSQEIHKLSLEKPPGSEYTMNLASKDLSEVPVLEVAPHTQVLYLDYNELYSIPAILSQHLKNLVTLSVIGNNLRSLPPELGDLRHLHSLYLNENDLTSLPESTCRLVNLALLNVTGNQLQYLPADLGQLSHLGKLCADENNLSYLPDSIGQLSNLHLLELNHNKLQKLPDCFGHLCSLEVLNLAGNNIAALPDSFCLLPHLKELDLSENKLKTLSATFSSQCSLQKFFCETNYLTALPEWFGNLPELQVLSIRDNQVMNQALPEQFGHVSRKLKYLHLGGNFLSGLPESLAELQHVTYLDIGSVISELEARNFQNGNWIMYLPEYIGKMKNLREAHLDENQLRELPESFGDLAGLEFLDVGQNMLRNLPESFCRLKRLRYCQFSKNNIEQLPQDFGQLTSLEDLKLNHNQLSDLPDSMKDLHQLKVLDLFHNKLTQVPTFIHLLPSLAKIDLELNEFDLESAPVPENLLKRNYEKRNPKWTGTWRGRCRIDAAKDVPYTELQTSSEAEEAETHGQENVPLKYDGAVLEIAMWRNLTRGMWQSHTGSDIRQTVEEPRRFRPQPQPVRVEADMFLDVEDCSESASAAPSDSSVDISVAADDHASSQLPVSLDGETVTHGEDVLQVTEEEDWDKELLATTPCGTGGTVAGLGEDEHVFIPGNTHVLNYMRPPKQWVAEEDQFDDADSDQEQ